MHVLSDEEGIDNQSTENGLSSIILFDIRSVLEIYVNDTAAPSLRMSRGDIFASNGIKPC